MTFYLSATAFTFVYLWAIWLKSEWDLPNQPWRDRFWLIVIGVFLSLNWWAFWPVRLFAK